jgi:hypothetical protein
MQKRNYFVMLKKVSESDSGADGEAGYEIPAVLTSEEHKTFDRIRGETGSRVYLLFCEEVLPEPGDIIIDTEKEYEITEVKICRDISGKVRAVRCTTLNN